MLLQNTTNQNTKEQVDEFGLIQGQNFWLNASFTINMSCRKSTIWESVNRLPLRKQATTNFLFVSICQGAGGGTSGIGSVRSYKKERKKEKQKKT